MPPRREFAVRFDALYVRGGSPPLRALSKAARQRAQSLKMNAGDRSPERPVFVSPQRISDWKAGRNVPSRFEAVLPVLLVLIDRVRRRGEPARLELVSLPSWKRLWERAQPGRPTRAAGSVGCFRDGKSARWDQCATAFVGREKAIADLARMVAETATDRSGPRIVALTGASAVGKTSLLQAGLVPLLESHPQPWTVRILVVGAEPMSCFDDVLDRRDFVDGCARETATNGGAHGGNPRLVIIDQFERIFCHGVDSGMRESFLTMVQRLARTAVVLISCRSSDVAACAELPELVEAVERRRYRLEPMGLAELRAAAELAHGDGTQVETGLIDVVLAALAGRKPDHEPAEISILSRTLASLRRRCTGSRLTVASYRRIGGVVGVIHDAAEAVWEKLGPQERTVTKQILLALVGAHAYTDDARRRIPYRELRCLTDGKVHGPQALDKLVDAKIITVDEGQAYLSHDLLLTWPRLVTWLDRERPALIIRGRTTTDSAEWIAADRDPSLLYRGLRLATAIHYLDNTSELAVEFLRDSMRAEQATGELRAAEAAIDVGARGNR
ncbi:ATP-binding protein [Mycolicibacterium sp. XJ870]